VTKFELVAANANNGWDDVDKKHWLIWSFSKAAPTVVWRGDYSSYQELLDKLEVHYGPSDNYKMELYHRRRRENETLRSLAQDVNRLMALAFPDSSDRRSPMLDCIAKEAFVRALDADLASWVLANNPQNLDDACRCAHRIEVLRRGDLASAEARGGPYARRKARDVSVAESVSGGRRVMNRLTNRSG